MPVLTEELAHLHRNKGNSGHRWQISCLEYSPNGALLASGSWDKEVRIWELSNLETSLVLGGVHDVPITSVSWYKPTGSLLCAGSADCTASLWDTRKGTHLASLQGHSGWVLDVCFSQASPLLATASWDRTVMLWDSVKQKQISNLAHHSKGVWSVDFKPVHSMLLCTGSEDGTVCLWDARSNKLARRFEGGHTGPVYCARWSSDGAMIASGSEDTKVCIWEPGSGCLINTISGHEDTVKDLCFNPQTQNVALPVLASAGDESVRLLDPRLGHKSSILNLSPHETGKEVEAVAISPDGSLLASGGRDAMIVLMTLFVPSVVPRSTNKSSTTPSKKTRFKDKAYIKEFSSPVEVEETEEDFQAELEAEELDSILTSPQYLKEQQKASRLKRKSRAEVKHTELYDHATVSKRGITAKKSRKRRMKGKSFDIPSMVAHLAASTKAYGPEEPASSGSDDEHHQSTRGKLDGAEGIMERIARLASPRDNPAQPVSVDTGDIGKLKKRFENRITGEEKLEEELIPEITDPELQFLQQSTEHDIPKSSTFDSSMTLEESQAAGQYGVLSQQRRQLKTSIQFASSEDFKVAHNDSDQLSDISGLSGTDTPSKRGQINKPLSRRLEGIEEGSDSEVRTEQLGDDTENLFSFLSDNGDDDEDDAVSLI